MEKLILIGGGGHCRACIDVIQANGNFEVVGILDTPSNVGKKILNVPIMGTDDDLGKYVQQGFSFHIAIGGVKAFGLRRKIFDKLKSLNAKMPTIISPLAYVSEHSTVGSGTIVMHHAVINANAAIGENNILNTKSLVEHDAIVGNNCHISTSSVINGTVKVGDNVYFGSNATAINNIEIPSDTIIGASTVVIKSIEQSGTYVGNPAKRK